MTRYAIRHVGTGRWIDYLPSVSSTHSTTADETQAATFATPEQAHQERLALGTFHAAYAVTAIEVPMASDEPAGVPSEQEDA